MPEIIIYVYPIFLIQTLHMGVSNCSILSQKNKPV
jgi:hypothetical protein